MSTIRGKKTATQNSEEITFSPSQGWSGRWETEGPKEAVRPMINQLAGLGYSFRYSCTKSPNAAITFETIGSPEPGGTGTEQPQQVWEYLANVVEIDILEADISTINSISSENKRVLRDAIAAPNPDSEPDFDPTDPLILNVQDLYELMLGGVRSYRVNVPTLKVSKLVSGSYGVKATLDNVGKVITTTALSIQESIPAGILFNLPNFTTAKSGFGYAWYKKHPNIQQTGNNRWNVSQEWEYGLWPALLHDFVT